MSETGIIALTPGAVFHERYRVVRRIKAGGMGAVYEVVDERTNSPRALKVMLPAAVEKPELQARFALEAKVTGSIVTDHIVRVEREDAERAQALLDLSRLRGVPLATLMSDLGLAADA
jgi:serine/threonine-protein kinase